LNYLEKADAERAAPFKSLESRMLKYKQECEQRYKTDLDNEIRRLKEFEVSRIRMEEAARYRDRMESFRNEMEELHLEKVKELKLREQSAMDRLRSKEQELEKGAFVHRQSVLKEEESMRYRENDVKKTVEMELYLIKAEKEKMLASAKEYEQKIAEMESYKLRLEKQHIESVEKFKSEYQRSFKDQDFEIHRRRLQVDEDEHRVSLEKDRLSRAETRCIAAEKELEELRADYRGAAKSLDKSTKEAQDAKDQLRVLNDNLKR
jgi:oral-facial-digital syndrome 1 protein